MSLIKLPIAINKKNGQISTYLKKQQLPDDIKKIIKEQPNALKRILIDLRGYE